MFAYNNIQESQAHAHDMGQMTRVMYKIARKTELETIAMKIVTVVALFFLPATFICVSRILQEPRLWMMLKLMFAQTFMSANIVSYTPKNTALAFFFELCLPFMALTLAMSWIIYRRVRSSNNNEYRRMGLQMQAEEKV